MDKKFKILVGVLLAVIVVLGLLTFVFSGTSTLKQLKPNPDAQDSELYEKDELAPESRENIFGHKRQEDTEETETETATPAASTATPVATPADATAEPADAEPQPAAEPISTRPESAAPAN